MAFVDMAFLKKTDLKCGLVNYNRRKTHQNLNIEWMKPMQAIIDKYAEQTKDSPYLLPILTGIIAKTKCAFFQNEMCIFLFFFRVSQLVLNGLLNGF